MKLPKQQEVLSKQKNFSSLIGACWAQLCRVSSAPIL